MMIKQPKNDFRVVVTLEFLARIFFMYAYFSTNTDENKNAPGLTEDITYYITGEPSKLQHQDGGFLGGS